MTRSKQTAITTIVTSDYISQAWSLYTYATEQSNKTDFIVLVIGERSLLESKLPKGPTWMFWDELINSPSKRKYLASE